MSPAEVEALLDHSVEEVAAETTGGEAPPDGADDQGSEGERRPWS